MEAANHNNISCAYQENQFTALCFLMSGSDILLLLSTVAPRYNEPRYNEDLVIMNNI